jgi:hypothetical protein
LRISLFGRTFVWLETGKKSKNCRSEHWGITVLTFGILGVTSLCSETAVFTYETQVLPLLNVLGNRRVSREAGSILQFPVLHEINISTLMVST